MTTESYRDKYDNPEKTAEAFRSDLIYANVVTGLYRPRQEDYSSDFKASRGNGLVILLLLALPIVTLLMAMFIPAMLEAKELTLIDHINSVRSKPLKEDKFLTNLAAERCRTMKEWSHLDYYNNYSKKIERKYKYTGEVLAVDFYTSTTTVEAWLNSPSHKEILLAKRYTRIGSSVCKNTLGLLTVVEFAGN